jgi:acyl carrier protein
MSNRLETQDLARARGFQAIAAEKGIQSLLVALAHELPTMLVGLDGSKRDVLRYLETRDCRLARLCAFYTTDAKAPSPLDFAKFRVEDRFGEPVACDFVHLDALPLTASGEIDRRTLTGLAGRPGSELRPRTAPRNELERDLAVIWRELLGAPEVYLEDSFFDLGGHSLLASQMLSRVRQRLGVDLTMHDLFHAPALEALADLTLERQHAQLAGTVESLVSEIEQLSADEIRAALTYPQPGAKDRVTG